MGTGPSDTDQTLLECGPYRLGAVLDPQFGEQGVDVVFDRAPGNHRFRVLRSIASLTGFDRKPSMPAARPLPED